MGKGILYDAVKCIGCRACQVACKQWNELPPAKKGVFTGIENPQKLTANTFTKVHFVETMNDGKLQWTFVKQQCMHCEHPACVSACPVGAMERTSLGVTYDDTKCIGCRYCMIACPFGTPNFQWDNPLPWIKKCTMCQDRQGGGLEPACATTCPSGALQFGERDTLLTEAKGRISRAPSRYVNHIYGENELGGTSLLYLSPVPFEQLGFPTLGSTPVNVDANRAMNLVPPVLVGVAAAMSILYWVIARRQKMSLKKGENK